LARARSAADDKAPIMATLSAIDAIRAARLTLKSNIKFAFEGEEEGGSTNFEAILAANKQLFSGDVWLSLDGPVHQSGRQTILFGYRGLSIVNITVYGARAELHSGHYGNWAPNPAMMLARLLTSMKDDNGRVLIDRFYDAVEPLGASEDTAGSVLGMPLIVVPIVNFDDNQHTFDENLRVQNLWDGVEIMAALLTM
jgi:acetylornithine deacetylase/succinyl-diaminopimelate desuccinylase-like protein